MNKSRNLTQPSTATFSACSSVLQCSNKEVRQRWFDSQPFAKYVHDLFMKQINPENLCHRRISDISPLKALLSASDLDVRDVGFCMSSPIEKANAGSHLQIFQEEYSIFFLNQGGSLVAIRHTPLPIRHIWWGPSQIGSSALAALTQFKSICGSSLRDPTALLSPRLSFDEGRNWDKYSFTSSPLYVDGVLGEPGEDILIMT